jgi:hypothetical protein
MSTYHAMQVFRPKTSAVVLVTVVITGTFFATQQTQLSRIRNAQRQLVAQHNELRANYAALLTTAEARDAEILRLRVETAGVPALRNQLAQARRQLATALAENQVSSAKETTNSMTGYLTSEQLRFAGFGSPENTVQSMRWACLNGDYTNWLATLAPQLQEEELANSQSLQMFQRDSSRNLQGMQILGARTVGSGHTALKVRLDTENSVDILIFPMVAVGGGWRLGGEIRPYSEAWDHLGIEQ